MEICGNMMKPIRKLWSKVAKKVGLRKSGHGKLRRDVLSCEYEDVRILWEMLKRNEGELARSASRGKEDGLWSFVNWASCAPFICRA